MTTSLLLLLPAAHAAVLTVDPDDESAYATIQAALDEAASGDAIELASGTWRECLVIDALELEIRGGN